ncbi:hypothetical protein BU17DRAFT_72606 [Hysterangium stoloniferum]|nr:hypothetical protein BU17DRAFT_72606 [Hysterangium stoloniferum]
MFRRLTLPLRLSLLPSSKLRLLSWLYWDRIAIVEIAASTVVGPVPPASPLPNVDLDAPDPKTGADAVSDIPLDLGPLAPAAAANMKSPPPDPNVPPPPPPLRVKHKSSHDFWRGPVRDSMSEGDGELQREPDSDLIFGSDSKPAATGRMEYKGARLAANTKLLSVSRESGLPEEWDGMIVWRSEADIRADGTLAIRRRVRPLCAPVYLRNFSHLSYILPRFNHQIPGLPGHYDYEWHPQDPRSPSRIPWVIHKGALSLSCEAYERINKCAVHEWFVQDGRHFFRVGVGIGDIESGDNANASRPAGNEYLKGTGTVSGAENEMLKAAPVPALGVTAELGTPTPRSTTRHPRIARMRKTMRI